MTEELEVMEEEREQPNRAIQVRKETVVPAELSVDDLVAQVTKIHEVQSRVMEKGKDYGIIPGCEKPCLLKPGAEKLGLVFRLAPCFEVTRFDLPSDHREYEVICTLTHINTKQLIGQGVGSCSTMEGKYRYRNGARSCPECGQETIIKGKKEYGGGWLCWQRKGGCGVKFGDDDERITGQTVGKVEHDNPADYFNTVLKMSKKRAHIDAILTATGCSAIFTQDLDEIAPVETDSRSQTRHQDPPDYDPFTEDRKPQTKSRSSSGDSDAATEKQVGLLRKFADDERALGRVDGTTIKGQIIALIEGGCTKQEASDMIGWVQEQFRNGEAA